MLTSIIDKKYIYGAAILVNTQTQSSIEMKDFTVTHDNYQQLIHTAIALYERDKKTITQKKKNQLAHYIQHLPTDSTNEIIHLNTLITKEHALVDEASALRYTVSASLLWSFLASILYLAAGHIPQQGLIELIGPTSSAIASALLLSAASLSIGCFVAHKRAHHKKWQHARLSLDSRQALLDPLSTPETDKYFRQCQKREKRNAANTLCEIQYSCAIWQTTHTVLFILLDLAKLTSLSLGPAGIAVNFFAGLVMGICSGITSYRSQKKQANHRNIKSILSQFKHKPNAAMSTAFLHYLVSRCKSDNRYEGLTDDELSTLLSSNNTIAQHLVKHYVRDFYRHALASNLYGLSNTPDHSVIVKSMLVGFLCGCAPSFMTALYAPYLSGLLAMITRFICASVTSASINFGINKLFLGIKECVIDPVSCGIDKINVPHLTQTAASFFHSGKQMVHMQTDTFAMVS
jgi:hypothetical protein